MVDRFMHALHHGIARFSRSEQSRKLNPNHNAIFCAYLMIINRR